MRRGILAACCSLLAWGLAEAQAEHDAHRHRLIGSRAKTGLLHATILFHESSPGRELDFALARQNVEEIRRAVDQIALNTDALEQEISPEDLKALEDLLRQHEEVLTRVGKEVGNLEKEVSRKEPSQELVRVLSIRVYREMKDILGYHQEAERRLNIEVPEEPQ